MIQRQGDVLLRRTHKSIKGTLIAKQKYILAHGETTGHYHELKGDVHFYKESNGQILCEVGKEGAVLEHQEHEKQAYDEGC